jgi:hypothetical protein
MEASMDEILTVHLDEPDPYSFIFSQDTSKECLNNKELNQMFLEIAERYANHRLGAEGYIFLNDVLVSIGLARTKTGAVTGWWLETGTGHISFGVEEVSFGDETENQAFKLVFNVDGVIVNKL